MTTTASQVLKVFGEMGRNDLDLHVLFEAAGNDPSDRALVLDAVEELKAMGLVGSRGQDFYFLTDKGKDELSKFVDTSAEPL